MNTIRLIVMALTINGLVLFGSSGSTAALSRKVCSETIRIGYARCHAEILTKDGIVPLASSGPAGYGPSVFRNAYNVHSDSTATVAVIGAYDAPHITNDLAVYSRTYSLPVLPLCTSPGQATCLEKLDQHGGTTYPVASNSWQVEESLDVEAIHGVCPHCRIELVEANSSSINNLSSAVATAVAHGASVVSNSYGGPESSGESQYDSRYHYPGVSIVVSSGDDGYGVNYPAASSNVVAVGGTHLQMNANRNLVVSETAWDGAGSGCSQFESKPAWQIDTKCARRSVADIAADADPATGAAIYSSGAGSQTGWFTVGGTSLAAPLIAGIVAASNNTNSQPQYLYSHANSVIRDIISGNNGVCNTYLCKTNRGYDGPTGLGVLNNL